MTTVTIGQTSVTRIEEMYTAGWDAPAFFPDWQPNAVEKHLSWMVPHHFDAAKNSLKLSIHSWLLRIGRRTVLVDTCIGNHKERPTRPEWHHMETRYLARLGEAGVRPEEIDLVMCTHLHADHVGWNTRLDNGRWVPTFPNARYVFSKADYDHYLAQERAGKEPNRGSFRDSVLPVVEAGLAQMVNGDEMLDEHLTFEQTGLRGEILDQDDWVCVARRGHPALKKRLDLKTYTRLLHIGVSYPDARPLGIIDRQLAERGLARSCAVITPHFLAAALHAVSSDCVTNLPRRLVEDLARRYPLQYTELPWQMPPLYITLVWTDRTDQEPAHRWFRDLVKLCVRGGRSGGPRSSRRGVEPQIQR